MTANTNSLYLIFIISIVVFSCSNKKSIPEKTISLKKINDSSFIILNYDSKTSKTFDWKINHPVYHFECADVDNDGSEDILIGVIKKTRFDSISRKRIFIFKLVEGYIRPLWLGSKLSRPLEDFSAFTENGQVTIRSVELEKKDTFLVAEYKWKGFGIHFIKYIARGISKETALNYLKKNKQ